MISPYRSPAVNVWIFLQALGERSRVGDADVRALAEGAAVLDHLARRLHRADRAGDGQGFSLASCSSNQARSFFQTALSGESVTSFAMIARPSSSASRALASSFCAR